MLRRFKTSIDRGNQQQRTIDDGQSFLIHSLMERVLKQGDAIAEMEATLVEIKNSLNAFKSVIQKVETNKSLSIPNLLTPIKNQTDQITTLKKVILELQNKVEILQTSLEQFKIEQYERMTNGRGKSSCKSWQTCLFFSSEIH